MTEEERICRLKGKAIATGTPSPKHKASRPPALSNQGITLTSPKKIEAISQLSPANVVSKKTAPSSQHSELAKAVASLQDSTQMNLAGAYVPKGLLKKKAPRSPDIKGASASKKLQALSGRASPKKKTAPGK
ncbi:hypothetical protein F2Q68_00017434 [Brassica cretica]|uniref:Uncharacterized protein n=2 Tax=Brassica cretica TaxID=69181 RepID=A0ABQ7FAR4_BRACR|nr:hypothetical protein F2Q68_00017434 [Brassica cretica]KAF3611809.1 hypothetical protein DY000_02050181 [Brassica cretica]